MTLSGFLIMLGFPLMFSRWSKIGVAMIVVGLVNALLQSIDDETERDKQENQFLNKDVKEIRDELNAFELADESEQRLAKCLSTLKMLARRVNKEREEDSITKDLESVCQEAAYVTMRLYPTDDEALAAALSLNALVANVDKVRERHLHEADKYGFDVPINVMKSSLGRAKKMSESSDEKAERLSAELQRKSCLLLGALANDAPDVAQTIVEEGGLVAVLDALSWFRFHEEVANWGLWAIFILCFDDAKNKSELVGLGGIHTICQTMKNIPNSLEVARHGVAILFDMMREVPNTPMNVGQIRKIALSAGMHDVILTSMNEFYASMEIMGMGQEILVATGYQGEIPCYQLMS